MKTYARNSSRFFFLAGFVCTGLFSGLPAVNAEEALSGREILRKIDGNYESESRISVGTMIIKGRRSSRSIKSRSYGRGNEKTFTEYLEPAREKGTKMLKIKDELWTYSPSADRIIKIAGHMLRQSVSGSDISYEDFMEDPDLGSSYEAKVTGEETYNERPCYILELTAIKAAAYARRKLWVDRERFLPLKQELYAKSGKLLKTFRIDEMFRVKDRWYPKKMIFKDALKDGAGTEYIIESVDFNAAIPEGVFSKASLRK